MDHPPSMGQVTTLKLEEVESSTEVTALLTSTAQEMVTPQLTSTASMLAPLLEAPQLESTLLEETTHRLHRPRAAPPTLATTKALQPPTAMMEVVAAHGRVVTHSTVTQLAVDRGINPSLWFQAVSHPTTKVPTSPTVRVMPTNLAHSRNLAQII